MGAFKRFLKKQGFKIGFAIAILILSLIIFFFYERLVGGLFLILAGFVYLTFLFKVSWVERFFAGLLAIFIFLFDILRNKIADNGLDYKVHLTGTTLVKAVPLFYLAFFVMFSILSFLVIRAVINNKGNRIRDMIVGFIGFLALVFLYAMSMIEFYHPPTFLIPFFNIPLAVITIYHIWIVILLIVMLYFVRYE